MSKVRMKATIPTRERSKLMADLLEKEIKLREAHLFKCAQEAMTLWDNEFGGDGLEFEL